MHECQQYAMTYVRKYGRTDLFITTICNSNWPEIKTNLLPGQNPEDCPELVAQVFRLTLLYNYSIEWQKHGLSHAHILMWLATHSVQNNGRSPDNIRKLLAPVRTIIRMYRNYV